MWHFDVLVTFLVASVGLTLAPGPDILYVLSQSLSFGWQKGFTVALGLVSGLILHTLGVALGLGFLIEHYPVVFTLIKFSGAAYLLYLAYTSWVEKRTISQANQSNQPTKKDFMTGFVMNVSNPKVSLFFLGFFPAFRFHDSWPMPLQFTLLGFIFMLQALLIFFGVSFFSGRFKSSFFTPKRSFNWNKMQAVFLMAIAILLLLS